MSPHLDTYTADFKHTKPLGKGDTLHIVSEKKKTNRKRPKYPSLRFHCVSVSHTE